MVLLKQKHGLGFDVRIGDAVTAGAKRFLDDQLASSGKIMQGLGIEPEQRGLAKNIPPPA